jgi:hypothetical protein
VEDVQRTKILEAMAAAMAARGANASAVTLGEALTRAGIDEVVGAEWFEDREHCVLEAFELGVQRARGRLAPAFAAESRWLDAIKAALAEFLRFLEDEPDLGRLLVVHSMGAGPRVLQRRSEVLATLYEVIDQGRAEALPGRVEPPPVIAEGVTGAVLAVIHNRLSADAQHRASLPGRERGAPRAHSPRAPGARGVARVGAGGDQDRGHTPYLPHRACAERDRGLSGREQP